MKRKALLSLIVLSNAVVFAAQTEYYIAPPGSDTNPGTERQRGQAFDLGVHDIY